MPSNTAKGTPQGIITREMLDERNRLRLEVYVAQSERDNARVGHGRVMRDNGTLAPKRTYQVKFGTGKRRGRTPVNGSVLYLSREDKTPLPNARPTKSEVRAIAKLDRSIPCNAGFDERKCRVIPCGAKLKAGETVSYVDKVARLQRIEARRLHRLEVERETGEK